MQKILIIGQAPPAVKQTYPYDTTMLYDWFSEIGISKPQAQNMFEFEAMVAEFPGYDPVKGGHKVPTLEEMSKHFNNILVPKLLQYKKVILLGNVPKNFFEKHTNLLEDKNPNYLCLIHPSKLNWNLYQKNKDTILQQLKDFVYDE